MAETAGLRRRARSLAVAGLVALLTALAVATVSAGPARASATSGTGACIVLPVTPALRSTLLRVHRATQSADTRTAGPVGRLYYGRCAKAFYALASFTHKTPQVDFGAQDQPERFRRRVGGRWEDRGDTGGFVCEAAPRALLKLWKLLQGC
jgi:hypothetical protein